MPYIIIMLVGIFGFNIFMILSGRSKSRKVMKKTSDERASIEKRMADLQKKLDFEQEQAARHVELQNKMFDMMEQARRRAAEREAAASGDGPEDGGAQ